MLRVLGFEHPETYPARTVPEMNITKGIMLPKTSMKSTEKNGRFTRKDNLMVVVHEKIIPAKEERDKRLMSYSIITTNHNNSSKARITEDKWNIKKSEADPNLVKTAISGDHLMPSFDDTQRIHECKVVGQGNLAKGAKCEGVYKPIFESSWPPSEYVGKISNCTLEPTPPEEDFSDILVDEEIDEFEHDYLPEDDDCEYCGKLSCT